MFYLAQILLIIFVNYLNFNKTISIRFQRLKYNNANATKFKVFAVVNTARAIIKSKSAFHCQTRQIHIDVWSYVSDDTQYSISSKFR